MRVVLRTASLSVLIGCVGDAKLGVEHAGRVSARDAGPADVDGEVTPRDVTDSGAGGSDGGAALTVTIGVAAPIDACGTCYDLTAGSPGAPSDATYDWDDGSRGATRRVCPSGASRTYSVTVHDPQRGLMASASVPLSPRVGTCTDAGTGTAALLCLMNGTFASDSSTLPALPSTFPASPWLACGTAGANFPQIFDGNSPLTLMQQPTDGDTYLGLSVGEQVEQPLCAPVPGGSPRSLTLSVAEVAGGVGGVSDMVGGVLEIWGGSALDCSQRELLWRSDTLTASWQNPCVTLMPLLAIDSITLRAVSAGALPYPGRVLVDHVQPVLACP